MTIRNLQVYLGMCCFWLCVGNGGAVGVVTGPVESFGRALACSIFCICSKVSPVRAVPPPRIQQVSPWKCILAEMLGHQLEGMVQ